MSRPPLFNIKFCIGSEGKRQGYFPCKREKENEPRENLIFKSCSDYKQTCTLEVRS